VQATGGGIAMALGGMIRDAIVALGSPPLLGAVFSGPAVGYVVVYLIELGLMIATIAVMAPLVRNQSVVVATKVNSQGV